MIVDMQGNPIDGQASKLIVNARSWQEQAASEIYNSSKSLSEGEILGHIKRYSDGIINHLMDCPVHMEMRVRVPGVPQYQPMVSTVIRPGQEEATAVRQMRTPIFVEAVMFEGKKI